MTTTRESVESIARSKSGRQLLLQAVSWLEHYEERELALSLLSCRIELALWHGENDKYGELQTPVEVTLLVPGELWSALALAADAGGLIRRAIGESLGRDSYVRAMHCGHLQQLPLAA
jgi:hypothetical protein